MRVVFLGTPEFGVPSLKALHAAGYELAGVFTQPDKPKGRGNKLQNKLLSCCKSHILLFLNFGKVVNHSDYPEN